MWADGHAVHQLLNVQDSSRGEDLVDFGALVARGGQQDLLFFISRRITDLNVEHEAV